jgi:opine dehydrogenase
MRVAILGAGGVGLATAALLRTKDHDPIIWSPSGKRTAALRRGAPIVASGALSGEYPAAVATSCGEAVAGADAVLVAVPGFAHRPVIDAAAPHLRPGQTVIVSSHISFSALYLAKQLAARGVALPIVAWGTTAVMARSTGPAAVHVLAVRSRFDVATLPAASADEGLAVCRALFGDRFVPRDDLLAIALSNLNPQNHLAQVLCNWTRIERGEDWANWDGYTPAVARYIEALDAERLAIAASFGVAVRTVHQHFHLSFGVPEAPLGEMIAVIAGRDRESRGPASMETRYVLEDVPYGLVPTTVLARVAGVPTPLHDGGIDTLSALYGRDFRAENDLLPELPIAGGSADSLHRLVREGWPRA